VYNKKPRLDSGGVCIASGDSWGSGFPTRAVLPDDQDGRGDDGRARVPGTEPL